MRTGVLAAAVAAAVAAPAHAACHGYSYHPQLHLTRALTSMSASIRYSSATLTGADSHVAAWVGVSAPAGVWLQIGIERTADQIAPWLYVERSTMQGYRLTSLAPAGLGWHTFKIVRKATTYSAFVDGLLVAAVRLDGVNDWLATTEHYDTGGGCVSSEFVW